MTKIVSVAFLILMMLVGVALVDSTQAQSRAKISGYILDSNGQGISGCNIIFNVPSIVPSVYSNGTGYYEMFAPPGTYYINVWPPFNSSYINYDEPGFVVDSVDIAKDIILNTGCKVSGYITDPSGQPITGAVILLNNYGSGYFSNSMGFYFLNVPAGTYTLDAHPRTGYSYSGLTTNFPRYNEYNFVVNGDLVKNITVVPIYYSPPANPTSAPTPNPTPMLPSTFLTMSAQATNPQVGSYVNVTGRLSDQNGNSLANKTVVLSYSVGNGTSWSDIGSGKTTAAGEYSIQWLIPASGTFTLKTQWAEDQSYLGSSNSTTLSILPYLAQKVFFVESNSTVTGLMFNSSDLTLGFTVSGPSGTKGYVKTTISKTWYKTSLESLLP